MGGEVPRRAGRRFSMMPWGARALLLTLFVSSFGAASSAALRGRGSMAPLRLVLVLVLLGLKIARVHMWAYEMTTAHHGCSYESAVGINPNKINCNLVSLI